MEKKREEKYYNPIEYRRKTRTWFSRAHGYQKRQGNVESSSEERPQEVKCIN
jgi:hypothetical protein